MSTLSTPALCAEYLHATTHTYLNHVSQVDSHLNSSALVVAAVLIIVERHVEWQLGKIPCSHSDYKAHKEFRSE
jgi:hypothetical protein